ncbi:3 phosphatase [uncultured virus]|nr:3 phosphatase [uncultured virus]
MAGWKKQDSCSYYVPKDATQSPAGVCTLAAFDLDSTLILSDRGAAYSGGVSDWIFAYSNTEAYLRELKRLGWTIAIFSNRKGPPWQHKHSQSKLDLLMRKLGIELWVFFATKDDQYRKPGTGMMELFKQLTNTKSFAEGSFYCGDAAGATSKDRWHQWSDVDRGLAKASGLTFYEPQDLFTPFPPPPIAADTNLLITQGQAGSGWDSFLPYLGRYIPLGDERFLYVITDVKTQSMIGPDPDKKNVVVVVAASHPSKVSRDMVRGYYRATFGLDPKSVVYLYCRPSYDKALSSKTYITNYQHPDASEPFFRIN